MPAHSWGTSSSRSPHGERGLKFVLPGGDSPWHKRSLPSRGAWIEILLVGHVVLILWSLPARGAWIEIAADHEPVYIDSSRSPQGERGLKYESGAYNSFLFGSLPARGAWIEIRSGKYTRAVVPSLPARGAWIEICPPSGWCRWWWSLPSRGAWIEIYPPAERRVCV